MMIKFISAVTLFLLLGNFISAQTAVFEYDEAGNQIFRGMCIGCKTSNKTSGFIESKPEPIAEKVAKSIRVAPVPVKTNLSIFWSSEIKNYIKKIELLSYNDSRILSFSNIKNTSNNSCIFNMESYSYGVYYLKFYLSDGSIYTKTITKN